MGRLPRAIPAVLMGLTALGFVFAAVAITFRLNMGDIRSGWPVTLWRATMFGLFLTMGLTLVVPIPRRRWFGMVVAGLIATLGVMLFTLALGTASASVAGLVLTLPAVVVCLGITAAFTTVFAGQIRRYR